MVRRPGPIGWTRYGLNAETSYEVSSRGDKRFSALFARLPDGRTIEEAYQLDIKGYRLLGYTDWRQAKGKTPTHDLSLEDMWEQYKDLWRQWALANPEKIEDLRRLADGKYLTDMFAKTSVSQARALFELLVESDT